MGPDAPHTLPLAVATRAFRKLDNLELVPTCIRLLQSDAVGLLQRRVKGPSQRYTGTFCPCGPCRLPQQARAITESKSNAPDGDEGSTAAFRFLGLLVIFLSEVFPSPALNYGATLLRRRASASCRMVFAHLHGRAVAFIVHTPQMRRRVATHWKRPMHCPWTRECCCAPHSFISPRSRNEGTLCMWCRTSARRIPLSSQRFRALRMDMLPWVSWGIWSDTDPSRAAVACTSTDPFTKAGEEVQRGRTDSPEKRNTSVLQATMLPLCNASSLVVGGWCGTWTNHLSSTRNAPTTTMHAPLQ